MNEEDTCTNGPVHLESARFKSRIPGRILIKSDKDIFPLELAKIHTLISYSQ